MAMSDNVFHVIVQPDASPFSTTVAEIVSTGNPNTVGS
ncbi:unannotated protein [freshwater metagenome]|uniref:Unannotated protein n=1 Tax=freshwater metagenome TaxID=449393 RepID=A0A6J7CR54_9ZZZZ